MTAYKITILAPDGQAGIHVLRAVLKALLRHFGLKAVSVEECSE